MRQVLAISIAPAVIALLVIRFALASRLRTLWLNSRPSR
jgi:hypothetical protein